MAAGKPQALAPAERFVVATGELLIWLERRFWRWRGLGGGGCFGLPRRGRLRFERRLGAWRGRRFVTRLGRWLVVGLWRRGVGLCRCGFGLVLRGLRG